MFTIIEAGTNPLYENHPVYVVYREDGSYWGLTQTTALDVLVDGLAQELGGRYTPRTFPVSYCLGDCGRAVPPSRFRCDDCEAAEAAAEAEWDAHVNA